MKIFIYYSNTGNGDFIAKILEKRGFDTLKIEPIKDLPNNILLKILIGGFWAMKNYQSELKTKIQNLDQYEEVYVGSPIWISRISSPINTVLENLKNREIKFIGYSGSGEGRRVKEQLSKYNVKKTIILKQPLKNKNSAKERLVLFISK